MGEHCLGGAYFVSRECLERLSRAGLIGTGQFSDMPLAEDWLVGIFTRVVGMGIGDFATDGYPMGLAWKGLPCSPSDLLAMGKKIIHSTRYWGALGEDEIRAFFRVRRI